MQTVNSNIKQSAQIEILVPKNTTTNQLIFPFPDQPFLRGKKIHSIVASASLYSALSGLVNVNAFLPLNNPLTVVNTNCFFLTLQDINGNQVVQNMPLLDLNPYNYNDSTGAGVGISKFNVDGILSLNPTEIVWTKSYISTPSPAFTTVATEDRGFQFSVFFN